jgi:hypothetical protein
MGAVDHNGTHAAEDFAFYISKLFMMIEMYGQWLIKGFARSPAMATMLPVPA